MSEINCATTSKTDSIIFCQELGLIKNRDVYFINPFWTNTALSCALLKYMKIIKLNKARKFISKKFVIEKSKEKIVIFINCNISNCSKGACNILKCNVSRQLFKNWLVIYLLFVKVVC